METLGLNGLLVVEVLCALVLAWLAARWASLEAFDTGIVEALNTA